MNIYVGNLNYNVTEDQLKDLFAAHGEVNEVKIITNKQTGQSKGFGFVTFTNEESAKVAIEKLNEQEFEGRKLRVSLAHK